MEENKRPYFQCLLIDEATEFWRTLRINSETSLRDVLLQFRQDFAREIFQEVSKYTRNQLTCDRSKKTFAEFLKTLKKTTNQAFGEKASVFDENFLLGKLPI